MLGRNDGAGVVPVGATSRPVSTATVDGDTELGTFSKAAAILYEECLLKLDRAVEAAGFGPHGDRLAAALDIKVHWRPDEDRAILAVAWGREKVPKGFVLDVRNLALFEA